MRLLRDFVQLTFACLQAQRSHSSLGKVLIFVHPCMQKLMAVEFKISLVIIKIKYAELEDRFHCDYSYRLMYN